VSRMAGRRLQRLRAVQLATGNDLLHRRLAATHRHRASVLRIVSVVSITNRTQYEISGARHSQYRRNPIAGCCRLANLVA